MNKIYTLSTGGGFREVVKNFQDKLSPDEEIVSTAINGEWFVITTRTVDAAKRKRNLLLEEAMKRPPKI